MWSEKHIQQLKDQGKIRGFQSIQKTGKNIPQNQLKNIPKGSKTKAWIELNLKAWCEGKGYELHKEFRFHPERKWRFDFAILDSKNNLKIAIEYEGIFSSKSRHTTISGFTGDADKYNAAAALGWKLLRYTAKNNKNLLNDLNHIDDGKIIDPAKSSIGN